MNRVENPAPIAMWGNTIEVAIGGETASATGSVVSTSSPRELVVSFSVTAAIDCGLWTSIWPVKPSVTLENSSVARIAKCPSAGSVRFVSSCQAP